MIRAPSSCGDPHGSASSPRAAALRGHCLPSPPALRTQPLPTGLTVHSGLPRHALSSLASCPPLGEGARTSMCSKARGPGPRGSLRRALPPPGRRVWDRAAESGVPQERGCCLAGTSTERQGNTFQGSTAVQTPVQHRAPLHPLLHLGRGPTSAGPTRHVPRALDPMPTRAEVD